MTDTTLIRRCPEWLAACECGLWEDHDGAHECDNTSCGGSWVTDENGELSDVVRFPGEPLTLSQLLKGVRLG